MISLRGTCCNMDHVILFPNPHKEHQKSSHTQPGEQQYAENLGGPRTQLRACAWGGGDDLRVLSLEAASKQGSERERERVCVCVSQPSLGSDPDVTIRCGTVGSWELLEEYELLDDDTMKFQVGEILDKENFTSVCPYSTISVKADLINMPFWSKLSDDERAMFMILALGCFGSLTGLACTYFLSPYVSNQPEEESEDEMVDVEPVHGDDENPSLRRFNLLTGEVETSERHGRTGTGLV